MGASRLVDSGRVRDIEHANQILPLVQTMVRRILRRQALRLRLEKELAVLELMSDTSVEPCAEFHEFVDKSVRFHRLGGQIDALVDRLRELGAEIRHRDASSVDFHFLRNDGLAALCWQPGEDVVSHWHPLHEPHATRLPIETTN